MTLTCPICQHKVAVSVEPCPVCGHALRTLRRVEIVSVVVASLRAFICACGLAILVALSRPGIGLGPFTPWQRDRFTDLFLDLRTAAFVFVGAGLLIAVGAPWWIQRRAVDQGIKASF